MSTLHFIVFALFTASTRAQTLDAGCVTPNPDALGITLCPTLGSTDGCSGGLFCATTVPDSDPTSGDECCPATTTSSSTSTATRTTTANTACFDLTNAYGYSDCPARAYLCTDSTYRSLMQTQCPATCGVCGTAVTFNLNVPCFDMTQLGRPSDCPRRASLCFKNPWVSLMRVQCPATCGYCSTTTNC